MSTLPTQHPGVNAPEKGYRCACGKPAVVRLAKYQAREFITPPTRGITLICPCEEHLAEVLLSTLRALPDKSRAPHLQLVSP